MPMSISSKTRVRGVGISSGFGRGFFDCYFQRQHYAAHFAARGDFVQRLHRLAGVGGDAVFHLVPAVRGPRRLCLAVRDRNLETHLHRQRIDLGLGQFGQLGRGGLPLRQISAAAACLIRLRGLTRRCAQRLQNLVAIFDFAQLARHILAEGDDFGHRLAVLAFQPVEQRQAVFNLGQPLGLALMPSA